MPAAHIKPIYLDGLGSRTIPSKIPTIHLNNSFTSVLGAFIISTSSVLAVSTTNSTKKPLRVGILYERVQLSDLPGLDLLGHQTPEIMAVNAKINPDYEPLLNLTTPMEFFTSRPL
jgi:hypothetical protein